MNLKLAEHSLTCKISPDELQQLEAGQRLRMALPTRPFAIGLEIWQDGQQPHFAATNSGQTIALILTLPKDAVALLRNIGRNRDGIRLMSDGLELVVQVDIRNDKRPRQEAARAS